MAHQILFLYVKDSGTLMCRHSAHKKKLCCNQEHSDEVERELRGSISDEERMVHMVVIYNGELKSGSIRVWKWNSIFWGIEG